MELVTGKSGFDHISAADLASMYRGLLIADDVVLATGDKLSCTMTDANTCEIGTGDCMLQAHHARVEVAEQLTVDSGSPGYNRNDLVVVRYTMGDGNIQDVYLAIIKGTATVGDAADPDYTEADIDGGATLVEFPLWRIPISGVNVGEPERIMPTVDTLQAQIASNDADIASLRESIYPIEAQIASFSGGWLDATYDFNSATNAGAWSVSGSGTNYASYHRPIAYNVSLIVLTPSTDRWLQICIRQDNEGAYIRTGNPSGWSSWLQL